MNSEGIFSFSPQNFDTSRLLMVNRRKSSEFRAGILKYGTERKRELGRERDRRFELAGIL